MRKMGPLLEEAEKNLREIEADFEKLLLTIPSIPSKDTPIGASDADNVKIRKSRENPQIRIST